MDTLKTIPFSIALFVIGAIFLLLSLTGGVTIGNYSLVFQETLTRVASFVAVFMEIKNKSSLNQTDGKSLQTRIHDTDISAEKFFYTLEQRREGFLAMVKDAARVQILVRTAVNLLGQNQMDLEEIGIKGCEIQLLLVDPASEMAKFLYGGRPEIYQNNITSAAYHLNILKQLLGHRLQVRVTKHAPTFSIINVEKPNLAEGFMQVQLYFLHSAFGSNRPIFRVKQNDKWYKIFRNEFNQLWSDSKEWDFSKYIEKGK